MLDDVEAFVRFADGLSPGFSWRVVGAHAGQVAELERLVGRPLPVTYRRFLAMMGRDDGRLCIGGASSTCIDAILEFYRDCDSQGGVDAHVAPHCIVMATIGVGTFDISLDTSGPGEPRLLYTSGRDSKWLCADSLGHLLYRTAWRSFQQQLRPLSFQREVAPVVTLSDVAAAARRSGFDVLPFSDSVTCCATRGEVALCASHVLAERPVHVSVFAADEREGRATWSELNAVLSPSLPWSD